MFEKIPLLEQLSKATSSINLKDVAILSCQHLLQGNAILFEYLFRLGLQPQRVFLLGKTYSTNHNVVEYLNKCGVFVHAHSTAFNSHESWDHQFERYVSEFLAEALPRLRRDRGIRQVIVIDEGGFVITQLNDMDFPWKVQCIEWTSSGYRKLLDQLLRYPVLNVARSKTKLSLESPSIGESIVRKIVETYPNAFSSPKKALVIGAGSIGLSVRRALEALGKIVQIIDMDTPFSREMVQGVSVMIGCTGEPLLGAHDLERLNDVLLVSASSSDREFAAVTIREQFPKNHDIHRAYHCGSVTLANGGFPINFDGSAQYTPLAKIQITLGLVFVGITMLTSKTLENGLNDFPPAVEDDIAHRYLALLG